MVSLHEAPERHQGKRLASVECQTLTGVLLPCMGPPLPGRGPAHSQQQRVSWCSTGGTGGGLLQRHGGDKPQARGTPQGHRWCLAARTMGWDAHGIVSIAREQAAQQSCQQQAGEGERNGASVP